MSHYNQTFKNKEQRIADSKAWIDAIKIKHADIFTETDDKKINVCKKSEDRRHDFQKKPALLVKVPGGDKNGRVKYAASYKTKRIYKIESLVITAHFMSECIHCKKQRFSSEIIETTPLKNTNHQEK